MSLNIHKRFKALVSESRKRNQMRVPAPDPPPPSIESLRTIVEAGHAPTRVRTDFRDYFNYFLLTTLQDLRTLRGNLL